MMSWTKLGRVFAVDERTPWAVSHAHLPTPVLLADRIRVFFAGLDAQKLGRVGWVDLDRHSPTTILDVSPRPVVDLGDLGAFDDSGVTPSCALFVGDELRLYYVGWQRAQRTPYALYGGLAVSKDGGKSFRRQSRAPVLDRSDEEPFSRGAPFVRPTAKGFELAYWSCARWTETAGVVHYNNALRGGPSPDGLRFAATYPVLLETEPGDFSVGRPWILEAGDVRHLWFTVRSHREADRIGYARSEAGGPFVRAPSGLDVSAEGWDAEMVCYAAVLRDEDRTWLFYNGNHHGASGFGVARLDGALS